MDNDSIVIQLASGSWEPLDISQLPAFTKQINTFEDLEDRNVTFSQEIILPNTHRNRRLLNFATDKQIGDYSGRNRHYPVKCYFNGLEVLGDGYVLKLTGRNQSGILCQIVSEAVDFFGFLDSHSFEDLLPDKYEFSVAGVNTANTYTGSLYKYFIFDPSVSHSYFDETILGHSTGFKFGFANGTKGYGSAIPPDGASRSSNDVFLNQLVPFFNWRLGLQTIFNNLTDWTLNAPFLSDGQFEDVYIPVQVNLFDRLGRVSIAGSAQAPFITAYSATANPPWYQNIDVTGLGVFNFSEKSCVYGSTRPTCTGHVLTALDNHGYVNSANATLSEYFDSPDYNCKLNFPQSGKVKFKFLTYCNQALTDPDSPKYYVNVIIFRYQTGTKTRQQSASYSSEAAIIDTTQPLEDEFEFNVTPNDLYEVYAYTEIKNPSGLASAILSQIRVTMNYEIRYQDTEDGDNNNMLFGQDSFYSYNAVPFDSPSSLVKEFISTFGLFADIDTVSKKLSLYSMKDILSDRVGVEQNIDITKYVDFETLEESYFIEGYSEQNIIEQEENNNWKDEESFTDRAVMLSNSAESGENVVLSIPFASAKPRIVRIDSNSGGLEQEGDSVNIPFCDVPALTKRESEYSETIGEYGLWDRFAPLKTDDIPKCMVRQGARLNTVVLHNSMRFTLQNTRNGLVEGDSSYYAPFNRRFLNVFNLALPVTSEYIKDRYFSIFEEKILTNPMTVNAEILLRPYIFKDLDLYYPVYIKEYGRYFYIKRINNFQGSGLTNTELIRI